MSSHLVPFPVRLLALVLVVLTSEVRAQEGESAVRSPDFGAVVVPESAWGAPRTVTGVSTRAVDLLSPDDAGLVVVPETVSLDLLCRRPDRPDSLVLRVPGSHLNGARRWPKEGVPAPILDVERGVAWDGARLLARFAASLGCPGSTVEITYRTAPASAAVVRSPAALGRGDSLDAALFGLVASADHDNGPALAWALLAAHRYRQPGRILTLTLPEGTYGFTGPLLLPDSVEIVGAGGTRLATRTDEFGTTFRPVVPTDGGTALRVLDGRAFDIVERPDLSFRPPNDLRKIAGALDQQISGFVVASGATYARLADLRLDGNAMGSWDSFERLNHRQREDNFRNAPVHTGLNANNHGGLVVPPGRLIVLDRVAATGWAATGALGHRNATWDVDTALFGDALYNHATYCVDGDIQNVTFTGYAWTWGILCGVPGDEPSRWRNLVAHGLTPSPAGRDGSDLLDIRNAYGSVEIGGMYADLRGAPGLDRLLWSNARADRTVALHDADVVVGDLHTLLSKRRPGPLEVDGLRIKVGGELETIVAGGMGLEGEPARLSRVRVDGTSGSARVESIVTPWAADAPTSLAVADVRVGVPASLTSRIYKVDEGDQPFTLSGCGMSDGRGGAPADRTVQARHLEPMVVLGDSLFEPCPTGAPR